MERSPFIKIAAILVLLSAVVGFVFYYLYYYKFVLLTNEELNSLSGFGKIDSGQNHSYSVVFRDNGEAVVYARIVVANSEDKPLAELSFEMPGAKPDELTIFQQKYPQRCLKYDEQSSSDPMKPSVCLEYEDPDYSLNYDYSFFNPGMEFKNIEYAKSGNVYNFTLAEPIESAKSGSIIVAYGAKGYAQKEKSGLFKFNFETFKVPSKIQQIKVGVDVDSGLFLKNRSRTGNKSDFSGIGLIIPKTVSAEELGLISANIGSGLLTKGAMNLGPNENLSLKGEYAKNRFGLYFNWIIAIIIIIGIPVGIHFLIKLFKKRQIVG